MLKIKNSTLPIIAKALTVAGFVASVLLGATPANALDFTFSFQDVGTNGFVTGTLSNLVEGNNAGSGITAAVTSSPSGGGVTSGYNFLSTSSGGNAFVVTGGNITFANVLFGYASIELYLGTPGNLGYTSALFSSGSFYYSTSSRYTIQFAPVTAVPFELNSTVGLATLGICFGAAKLRRKHLAKKVNVTV
ncbi:hypothetical protein WJM97_05940 [Okeanomitos corallinicola TIOX110]|uniref:PEP-CTERM protein-sorting domain-containing protein n=1 Tax=Okeanomitos corallinicola TIOX110 TaxID=3133117 RepID=A0ABZ2UY45_9CYAN